MARDEAGTEHRLNGELVEKYSLSSGSEWYHLHIPEVLSDCHWLVGRTLELSELAGHPCNIGSTQE
jgi:hypothetical protein